MNHPIPRILLAGLALLASGCILRPRSHVAPMESALDRLDPVGLRMYQRAINLEEKGQIASSLVAFREAERRFGDDDRWGKSLAIYGRANALERVGQCGEAKVAYAEYAAFVRPSDSRSAGMALAYAAGCREHSVGNPPLAGIVAAIYAHADVQAVALAERATSAENTSPWLDYYRAVALSDLGRTDEAVDAFKRSSRRFEDDAWARSISIYGQARALDDAHRCSEAQFAYVEYAAFVRPTDPLSADMALGYATQCK